MRKWGEVFIPTNQLPYLRLQIITRICACEIPPPDLEKPVAFAQALMSEAAGKVLRFWRENGIYSNLKPYELILWALENDNPPSPRKPKYKKNLDFILDFKGLQDAWMFNKPWGGQTNKKSTGASPNEKWPTKDLDICFPKNGGIFPWWSTTGRIRKKHHPTKQTKEDMLGKCLVVDGAIHNTKFESKTLL